MAIDRCAAQAASAHGVGRGALGGEGQRGGQQGVGAPMAEVKKHRLQKGIVGSHGYTTVQKGITKKADSPH